jgi:hypothetical protein
MSIIDFKAMKHDKELFDSMADKLIKDTLTKKKRYDTLYNNANKLKNEINQILLNIQRICYEQSVALSKDIHEYTYPELEDILVDIKIPNINIEELKINIYKIKIRLDEINKLRTEMIQLDLYENHINDMEDDTLDEEYIDMDKIREERGISPVEKLDEVLTKFDYSSITSSDRDEYYNYVFDGKASLKDVASEVYGNPSYWVYIYNYSDNASILNKIALDNYLEIDELINNKQFLSGLKLKLPKEIEFYSEEFNTSVLKKIS